MNKFVFAIALLGVPGLSHAASVSHIGLGDGIAGTSPMSVSVTETADTTIDVDFSWDSVPDGGLSSSIEFEAEGGFELYYTDYTDLSIYQQLDRLLISGGILQKINGSGDVLMTYEFNAMDAECGPAEPVCMIVSGPGSYKVGSVFDNLIDIAYYPDSTTPIITVNDTGLFRLTAAESNNPPVGFMSFSIQAADMSEVPLPAGLPLLLAGLGTLAVARRRR